MFFCFKNIKSKFSVIQTRCVSSIILYTCFSCYIKFSLFLFQLAILVISLFPESFVHISVCKFYCNFFTYSLSCILQKHWGWYLLGCLTRIKNWSVAASSALCFGRRDKWGKRGGGSGKRLEASGLRLSIFKAKVWSQEFNDFSKDTLRKTFGKFGWSLFTSNPSRCYIICRFHKIQFLYLSKEEKKFSFIELMWYLHEIIYINLLLEGIVYN